MMFKMRVGILEQTHTALLGGEDCILPYEDPVQLRWSGVQPIAISALMQGLYDPSSFLTVRHVRVQRSFGKS